MDHDHHLNHTENQNTENGAERFVIVGSGIAAVAAAEEIRRLDPHASIVMIGEENALPYLRPALSRELILPGAGERFPLHPPEWYSLRGIFLLSGRRALRLLPRAKQLELSDGTVLHYNKCILATGAESVVPPLEGVALPGVFTLRTLTDLERLANHLRPDMRAVVLGGGPLGLALAWQLYLGGCHVTVLEAEERLLGGRVDGEITDRLIRLAAARGVTVRTRARVSELRGEGQIEQVILPGEYLNADLVLLCCGTRPRVELAREAGLETARGIAVNARMMTNKYGIYACGDCAELGQDSGGTADVAARMGQCAGRNAAGEDTLYHPTLPTLWLEAFGTRLFAAGDCGADGCTAERRPSGTGEAFLYREGGRLRGAVLLGDVTEATILTQQLERGSAYSTV